MRPVLFKVNLSNQSATVVAAAQQIAAAGALTLAAGASAIDASGAARYLLFTTNEDDHLVNAVVVGLDADGNSITETTALPNNTTKVSTNAYASVSSITLSAGITANMSVGTSNATSSALSKTIVLDRYARTGSTVIVEITGTVVYTVQETFDNILNSATSLATWFNGSLSMDTQNTSGAGTVGANLVSKSSVNSFSQMDKGASGMRISITSYTNGATMTVQVITERSGD